MQLIVSINWLNVQKHKGVKQTPWKYTKKASLFYDFVLSFGRVWTRMF